jgi:hypothetical protein
VIWSFQKPWAFDSAPGFQSPVDFEKKSITQENYHVFSQHSVKRGTGRCHTRNILMFLTILTKSFFRALCSTVLLGILFFTPATAADVSAISADPGPTDNVRQDSAKGVGH